MLITVNVVTGNIHLGLNFGNILTNCELRYRRF